MSASGSVRFDRAAEYYDSFRGGSEVADVELLVAEFEGKSRVLEVGVGTGLLALPLHTLGIPLFGLDLSQPMLGKLVEKNGGRRPFPLALGDATSMPFLEGSCDAAYTRWVLHLIPSWKVALAEMARVVRPGGSLLINLGGADPVQEEVRLRLGAEAGMSAEPVGLGWGRYDLLDEAMEELGGRPRAFPTRIEHEDEPLGAYLDAFERGVYSWTWPIPEEGRRRSLEAVRPWAEERFGPLDRPLSRDVEVVWRAYDLG
jgi:SAM-dependent methyltransferase